MEYDLIDCYEDGIIAWIYIDGVFSSTLFFETYEGAEYYLADILGGTHV